MYIFLRGLPGTGKTSVAKKLNEEFGWPVQRIDDYKITYRREHSGADFSEEVVPESYKNFLQDLQETEEENMIIAGLFKDPDLVAEVNEILQEKGVEAQWYLLKRDKEKLLEVERKRDREVTNSPEELGKMKEEIESIDIEDEKIIEDANLDEVVEVIKQHIKTKQIFTASCMISNR